jgi:hypothetical protein
MHNPDHSLDRRRSVMNTKNMLIASLVGGVISTFLSNIPFINLVNCLVCAGFWAGPLFAVWFYKRLTGTLSLGQGIGIGTIAGIWAGIFGFLLSLIGLAGAAALMQSYSQFLPPDAVTEAIPAGSVSLLLNFAGVLVNIIFGVIGGLIGGAVFKTKTP